MATTLPDSRRRETLSLGSSRWGMIGDALSRPMASYYLVLASSILLAGLGALMVLSSSSVYAQVSNLGPYYFAQRQFLFLLLGLPAAWWLSRRDESTLKKLSWVAMAGALLLLVLVFTPLGYDAGKGNRNWLNLGILRVQPSEFAKLALVIWSAHVLSVKKKVLDQPRQLAPVFLGFALVEMAVLAGKDLGTALVIAAIFFTVLWIIGLPLRYLGGMVLLGVAGVGVLVLSSPNRMDRILAFMRPHSFDPNASQQPINAVFALATGGWWGLGLGASRQKWGGLYDGALNDYVFAVLGEELGLMGTLAVLGLFMVLGYAGIRIALRSDSYFCRMVAAGITGWMMFQTLVNIGVAMKLLPVVGVPLPFISAGGSALMSNLLAVGILLACARHEPAARRALAVRSDKRPPRVTTVVDSRR